MKIKGKDLLVFLDMENGDGYKSIALSTSCSLDVNVATIPILSADSWMWQHFIPGKMSWTVETTAQMTTDVDPLALLNRTVKLMFGTSPDNFVAVPPGSRKPNGILRQYGMAVLTNLGERGEKNGIATYSMTFQGSGELHHDAAPVEHGAEWYNPETWVESEKYIEE